MHIDIQFVPSPPKPNLLSKRAAVVIDVLRATSVMVQAMSQGALEIMPVATVEEAFQTAKTFPQSSLILGGERGSKKIPGFDLGNSPREYVAERVKGKKLILTTTNGTKAFHVVSSGREILVGSFFNIEVTAQRCLELNRDLLIFPSGNEGKFSLEDTICGGMLIELIMKKGGKRIDTFDGAKPRFLNRGKKRRSVSTLSIPRASDRGVEWVDLSDASRCAQILYKKFKDNLSEALHLSHHGKKLINRGFEEDLGYCAQTDMTDIVPEFRDGVIRVPLTPFLSPGETVS